MVEIRYAGVTVARSSAIRELDKQGLFLGLTEPLPTGTDVVLKIGDDEVPARVATVFESADIAKAGMRVLFAESGKADLFGTPGEAPVPLAIPVREASGGTPSGRIAREPAAPEPVSGPASGAARSGAVSGAVAASPASGPTPTPPPPQVATPEAAPSGNESGRRIVVDASADKPVPDRAPPPETEQSKKQQKKSKRR